MVDYQKRVEGISKGNTMSDRTYAQVQAQQKTVSGSSPKSSLLQRTCACGQHTIAGGECSTCRSEQSSLHRSQRAFEPPSAPGAVPGSSPDQEHGTAFNSAFDRASRFGHDFSRIPLHPPAAGAIQTKLAINQPGDEYEQEADRIADQVMATPTHHAVSSASPSIQRFSGQSNGPMDAAPASVDQALASTGRPLEPALRQDMEQHFGHDFSRVRVHSGAAAEQSAQDVNAHAYTVGHNIVFGAGRFAPGTHEGRRLIAHELTHVVQQSGLDGIRVDKTNAGCGLSPIASEIEADKVADVITDTEKLDHGTKQLLSMQQSVSFGTLQRTPAAPVTGAAKVPFDRNKVDVSTIPDVLLDTDFNRLIAIPKVASVRFIDPAIKSYSSILYDPADHALSTSTNTPIPGGRLAIFPLFVISITGLTQGRHILRCIGYDGTGQPVAYADRSFYVWTSKPTGRPPDIAALEAEKTSLEAITKVGSGKTFDEVAIGFTKLMDVNQRLGVLETGTGPYVGSHCRVQPAGAEVVGCTNSVLIVLKNVFTQQGRGADWDKLEKKIHKNTLSHSKKLTDIEGEDIQAALQSEFGWKGIFWAPDPKYEVPKEELSGARSDEAGYAAIIAKRKGIYRPEKKNPAISIDYSATDYAPEVPKPGHGEASKTKKDITQLDKLKKVPFGVLSAHGAHHMAFIIYGKVVEVHWDTEATDVDLIEQTDLEKWAVGTESGYHYFASGAIVAPAADVDAAFK